MVRELDAKGVDTVGVIEGFRGYIDANGNEMTLMFELYPVGPSGSNVLWFATGGRWFLRG